MKKLLIKSKVLTSAFLGEGPVYFPRLEFEADQMQTISKEALVSFDFLQKMEFPGPNPKNDGLGPETKI